VIEENVGWIALLLGEQCLLATSLAGLYLALDYGCDIRNNGGCSFDLPGIDSH
jgi:hypothetical protein